MLSESLFWIFLFTVFFTYAGYPVLLALLTIFKTQSRPRGFEEPPFVSLVISAFNEEEVIRRKLGNSLGLDYPKDKLEILVVSDGSTDSTSDIVREYETRGIKLLQRNHRAGKTSIQNFSIHQTTGEIIVFSDANAIYEPESLANLVQHFSNKSVGCVCGELRYRSNDGSVASDQENIYWEYEKFLKRKENLFGTILGANGSIYAVRKSDYQPLSPNIISDFIEPLKIVEKGKRVVYEPTAISIEDASQTFNEEFKRKKRIILRSIYSLFACRNLLNILKKPKLSFQLISHKIIRWAVPVFLIGIFITNLLLLGHPIYRILFYAQLLFYFFALTGFLFEQWKIKSTIFYMPFYFVLVNLAALLAIVEFILGKNVVSWVPNRNHQNVEKREQAV